MNGRQREYQSKLRRRHILLSCIFTAICVIMTLYIVFDAINGGVK